MEEPFGKGVPLSSLDGWQIQNTQAMPTDVDTLDVKNRYR